MPRRAPTTRPTTVDGFGLPVEPVPPRRRGPEVGGLELDPEALTRWIIWGGIVLSMTFAVAFWRSK
jgi:hypothetical protein